MTRRKYQELFCGTERFTAGTRTCLERAVGRALFGHKDDGWPLRSAVYRATRELRAQGLDAAATLAVLSAVVEDAGRACRADRTSLVSGMPLWMPVRSRVLAAAEHELAESVVDRLVPTETPGFIPRVRHCAPVTSSGDIGLLKE